MITGLNWIPIREAGPADDGKLGLGMELRLDGSLDHGAHIYSDISIC